MFTPEIQKRLGDAALVPDGDRLFVGNTQWLILFNTPYDHFPAEVLDYVWGSFDDLQENEEGYVDWKILNAVKVDWDNKQFLPPAGRRFEPIHFRTHQRILPATLEEIRGMSEAAFAGEGETFSLSQAYREGKLQPHYENGYNVENRVKSSEGSLLPRKRMVFNDNPAASYFYIGDEFIIGVHAALLEALTELGVDLEIYTERTGVIPAIGGMNLDTGIIVTAGAVQDREHNTSPDGRRLSYFASSVCWYTVEQGIQSLLDDARVFNPLYQDQGSIIARILDQDRRVIPGLKGVDILRWHGVSEDKIREILEEVQQDAWPRIHEAVLADARLMVDRISEAEADEIQGYQLGSWESRVKSHCQCVDALSQLLGQELGLGDLPDLVEMITELKESIA